MKTNLKRIGALALCFMLLLSCIPVSADDGVVQTRDFSAGYSLDSALPTANYDVSFDSKISYSDRKWSVPVYYYLTGTTNLTKVATITVGRNASASISPDATYLNSINATAMSIKVAAGVSEAAVVSSTDSLSVRGSTYNNIYRQLECNDIRIGSSDLSDDAYNTYAVFVEYKYNTVTATFDLNGGTATTDITPITKDPGARIDLPAAPKNDGYTFRGWLSDVDGKTYPAGATVTLNANTTFTAQWSEKIQQYITVGPATLTIGTGLTQQLSVAYLEGANRDATITWSVADDSIASVSEDGVVTAITPGTTTVTATYTDGEVVETATCVVNVVATAALYLDQNEIFMVLGSNDYATFDLTAFYEGANERPGFTWTTSDPNVVSLSVKTSTESDGKSQTVTLTAQSVGTAYVTVTAEGLLQQCAVTVVAADTTIQDAYFYLLKPAYSLDTEVSDPRQKWYTIGPGKVKADSATNHAVGYTEYNLNVVQWPAVATYAPTIEVDSKTYRYASSGSQEGTYTIEWMYRKVDNGANNANSALNGGAAFVPSGTNTWHIDGCIVLHDATKMNINYKVKQPGNDSFTLAFLTGSEAAPSGKNYPQVVNQNYEYTVENQLSSKTYNNETYDFDGWYTDEACTQKVTSSTITIVKDMIFYGKYVRRVDTGTVQFKKIVREPEFTSGSTTFSFTLTPVSVNTEDYNKWLTANSRLFSNGTILVTVAGQAGGVSTSSTVTLSDLPVGTYTLAEVSPTTDAKEYTTTYQIGSDAAVTGLSATITVTKDYLINVTFTNTFVPKTADLTITKNVANLPTDNLSDDNFTFTVKDLEGNVVDTSTALQNRGSYTFEDLEAGTYTVTESVTSATEGGTAHSYEMTAAEDQTEITVRNNNSFEITIVAGVDRSVTVTNTCNDTVDLTVYKVWEDEGWYQEGHVGSEDEESWPAYSFRPESVTMTLAIPQGVTAPDGIQTRVTLSVDSVDENGYWTYTWEDLPKYMNGNEVQYTVSESQVSGYSADHATVTFVDGEATITNRIQLGYIDLSKVLIDRTLPGDVTEKTFTITLASKTNAFTQDDVFVVPATDEEKSPIQVPYGSYTLTESAESATGYDTTVQVDDGTAIGGRTTTVTVGASNTEDNPVSVVFTNTLKTYSLTVEKQIAGNMADSQKDFTFTAKLLKPQSGEGDSGEEILTYVDSGLNFTNVGLTPSGANGVTFKLKANEFITLNGIPYGYSVSVTESGTAGYTVKTSQDGGSNWSTPTAAGADGSATVGPFTYDANVQPKVIFKNTNNATIDTGVTLDFLPYVLLILGVGVVVALWLVMSAKKRKDD